MRKRLLISLLLCTVLLLALPLAARAEAKLDYVNDYANLLTAEQRDSLNARAASISQQYGFPVYIVVVDDLSKYVQSGGIEYFAEEVFRSYELGVGQTGDGVMLAMSMGERVYDIYAHGDFGNYAFTDYGKQQLAEPMLDRFAVDDWAGGFAAFIDKCGDLLSRAKNGNPVDIWIPDPSAPELRGITPFEWLVIVTVSCIVAGSVVGGFKKQMKTAVKQTRAGNYVAQGGVHLREKSDTFVNRTVTTTPIPKSRPDSSRPSGGHYGGTTVSSSSGGSHSSGKF